MRFTAAGTTNQETTMTVCRSPSTVVIHVRRILGNTLATDRAESAPFGFRHDLL
jgi:DNA-binding NarL/FixJ family response regulator